MPSDDQRQCEKPQKARRQQVQILTLFLCNLLTLMRRIRRQHYLIMLKAEFGALDANGNFISLHKMLSAFNIYCLDDTTERFLLILKQEDENSPLILVENGTKEFVFPEKGDQSKFAALKRQTRTAQCMDAERLPSEVQTILLSLIPHFAFEEKNDK